MSASASPVSPTSLYLCASKPVERSWALLGVQFCKPKTVFCTDCVHMRARFMENDFSKKPKVYWGCDAWGRNLVVFPDQSALKNCEVRHKFLAVAGRHKGRLTDTWLPHCRDVNTNGKCDGYYPSSTLLGYSIPPYRWGLAKLYPTKTSDLPEFIMFLPPAIGG